MTTLNFNTEELKRKIDVEEGGPIQKILKRSITSEEQASDIFSQSPFSLNFDEHDEDDFDFVCRGDTVGGADGELAGSERAGAAGGYSGERRERGDRV